jgi:hypothetical protein
MKHMQFPSYLKMHDIWDKLISFLYHLALYVICKMLWHGLENKYSEPFVYG